MIITSFSLVAVDLGQQPKKVHQNAGDISGFACATKWVLQRWSWDLHATKMEAE
jgi:hypothetical protein